MARDPLWLRQAQHLPKPIPSDSQRLVIETLVNQILTTKQANPQTDVSAWKAGIDRHVYALYSLTPTEIAIVEGRG